MGQLGNGGLVVSDNDVSPVDLEFWISITTGLDTNPGTLANPWATLERARVELLKYENINSAVLHLLGTNVTYPPPNSTFDGGNFLSNGVLIIKGENVNILDTVTADIGSDQLRFVRNNNSPTPIDTTLIGKTLEILTGAAAGNKVLIRGHQTKIPCKVASTANIPALTGLLTVDGVVLVNGDRVLVKNQTSDVDNGIYVVGTPWTRDKDAYAGNIYLLNDASVFIQQGTVNANTTWYQQTEKPNIGTDPNTWTLNERIITPCQQFLASIAPGDTARITEPSVTVTLFATGFGIYNSFELGINYGAIYLINLKDDGSQYYESNIKNFGVESNVNSPSFYTVCAINAGLDTGAFFSPPFSGFQALFTSSADPTAVMGWGMMYDNTITFFPNTGLVGYFVFKAGFNSHTNDLVYLGSFNMFLLGGRMLGQFNIDFGHIEFNPSTEEIICYQSYFNIENSALFIMSGDGSGNPTIFSNPINGVNNAAINASRYAKVTLLNGQALGYNAVGAGIAAQNAGQIIFDGPLQVFGTPFDAQVASSSQNAAFFAAAGNGIGDFTNPNLTGALISRVS